jgi:galactonate dehydratase
MKVTSIETFVVKGLTRPWLFCAIHTDEGITGYSEFGQGQMANGMCGLVEDLSALIIGKDPRPVERHYINMARAVQSAYGGATWQAMAGIELALWDIKGKVLGVPVYELVGGPTRDHQKVYWSHFISYQTNNHGVLGRSPVRSYDDLRAFVKEAMKSGYDSFKTNIQLPGDPFTGLSQGREGPHDQTITKTMIDAAYRQVSIIREEGGAGVNIALDVNQHFKADAHIRLAQALEPLNLMWMELDNLDAESCRMLKDATRTPICTGEQKLGPLNYYPLLERRAMDVMKLDLQWQGFIPARRAAAMAEHFEINIAPHNYNTHMSMFQTMNLCASVTNVKISESDPVQAPWRDELVTVLPEINNGVVTIPKGPGWGTELKEDALRKYAYTG